MVNKVNKDNKKFIIETFFLKEALKQDLSLSEFLILVYFDNDYDYVFDVRKITKATCLKEEEVVSSFSKLLDKGIITLVSAKNENGKMIDKVSLDNLYKDIKKSTNEDGKEDFLITFQKKYGHSLSSNDYEIVKAWLAEDFTEEIILGAVEEANYNGVSSLSYIDKVLFTWQKKGFKTMKDVNNHLTKQDNSDDDNEQYETSVLDFNWLEDDK